MDIQELKDEMRGKILRCKTDARSVLLSMPAQHRCDKCGNLWVVGDEPPMCKMFDYEKHSDHVVEKTALAVLQMVEDGLPDEVICDEPNGMIPENPEEAADQSRNFTIQQIREQIQTLVASLKQTV